MSFEEGPLYYREIQKNAYLKRVPNESSTSKLKQLGCKKVPLKPMWTLFCIHNGKTPYLEQYQEAEAPTTLAHKPVWRACLRTTRHVTASVKPRMGVEYDFLIDTDHGPVRMIAPDWDSMQDWVNTLRNKLHELKILSKGENVYCAAPAVAPPRAAARDPTSPLPPTPPVPPDRVPGIELIPPRPPPEEPEPPPNPPLNPEPIDISNWEENPQPSTSQEVKQPKSVTKICGQNICLDDSILKRSQETTDSDEEFFAEVDRIHASAEEVNVESCDYKQTVVVNDTGSSNEDNLQSESQATNITVIQVSNKGPPHTAIPVLGPETNVFDFDFEQKVKIEPENRNSFVNIVNTEVDVQSNDNSYGTVFSNDGDYGHLSLTTTVNLTDNSVKVAEETQITENSVTNVDTPVTQQESVYERLCMASTSNEVSVSKVKNMDKARKSSLPNLESASTSESAYEYLFPNQNNNIRNNGNNVSVNGREYNGNESRRPVNLTNSFSVGIIDRSARTLRSNIERSHSQNAYDTNRIREPLVRKRDSKNDKQETVPPKPIWKRGLTELSLLTRLRGITAHKRQDSPTRQENDVDDSQRMVTSPVKVVRRPRPEGRVDTTRRRSSSLSNGHSPPIAPIAPVAPLALQPLRARQAAALRADQRRGAAVAATVPVSKPPIFADYEDRVWVAWWGVGGSRSGGRAGDRVAAVRAIAPRGAEQARIALRAERTHMDAGFLGSFVNKCKVHDLVARSVRLWSLGLREHVWGARHPRRLFAWSKLRVDILFHRVPLGKIYVLNRRDNESIGIKLDSECNIVTVDRQSPAGRAGLPPPGKWAVTEVNNRPINLLKGGDEEIRRLFTHGTEISVLIQPSPLVKKLRAALKANKHLLSSR